MWCRSIRRPTRWHRVFRNPYSGKKIDPIEPFYSVGWAARAAVIVNFYPSASSDILNVTSNRKKNPCCFLVQIWNSSWASSNYGITANRVSNFGFRSRSAGLRGFIFFAPCSKWRVGLCFYCWYGNFFSLSCELFRLFRADFLAHWIFFVPFSSINIFKAQSGWDKRIKCHNVMSLNKQKKRKWAGLAPLILKRISRVILIVAISLVLKLCPYAFH